MGETRTTSGGIRALSGKVCFQASGGFRPPFAGRRCFVPSAHHLIDLLSPYRSVHETINSISSARLDDGGRRKK